MGVVPVPLPWAAASVRSIGASSRSASAASDSSSGSESALPGKEDENFTPSSRSPRPSFKGPCTGRGKN